MALKKGVCKNYGNCPLADNDEIQEVDSSEFRCTECGKELHEVTGEKAITRIPKRIVIVIVAAIIIIGGGLGVYWGTKKVDNSGTTQGDTIDSGIIRNDTIDDSISMEPDEENKEENVSQEGDNPPNPLTTDTNKREGGGNKPTPSVRHKGSGEVWGTIRYEWFTYEGPCKNGKPADGVLGEMRITQDHIIDLKDLENRTLEVKRGDKIVNPKFKNGQFMLKGELCRVDGTRRLF